MPVDKPAGKEKDCKKECMRDNLYNVICIITLFFLDKCAIHDCTSFKRLAKRMDSHAKCTQMA